MFRNFVLDNILAHSRLAYLSHGLNLVSKYKGGKHRQGKWGNCAFSGMLIINDCLLPPLIQNEECCQILLMISLDLSLSKKSFLFSLLQYGLEKAAYPDLGIGEGAICDFDGAILHRLLHPLGCWTGSCHHQCNVRKYKCIPSILHYISAVRCQRPSSHIFSPSLDCPDSNDPRKDHVPYLSVG